MISSKPISTSSCGFTLMEIALALLVISIGVLAIIGVMSSSLEAANKSIDDTHAAMFADDILHGFQALGSIDWEGLEGRSLPPPAETMWEGTAGQRIEANGGWQTIVYESAYVEGLIDYAVQFNLDIRPDSTRRDVKTMRLEVVSGEFADRTNPLVFYTEVFRQRGN
jgi:type II secretory pathway pseudopilin PulG